jgi:hypothetical protein
MCGERGTLKIRLGDQLGMCSKGAVARRAGGRRRQDEGVTNDEPFNPSIYPDEFTVEVFRDTPVRDLIKIERHLDELSTRQRETFIEARDEVMGPITAKIRDATAVVPKMRPIIDPAVAQSFRQFNDRVKVWSRVSDQLRGARVEPITGSLNNELPAPEVSFSGVYTPGELERDVDRDTEMLSVLTNMLKLQERQQLSTTRGWFFGLVVSMSVVIAGVAPIVSAESWAERWWIIGISAVVGGIAWCVYLAVRAKQKRSDTPATTPDS